MVKLRWIALLRLYRKLDSTAGRAPMRCRTTGREVGCCATARSHRPPLGRLALMWRDQGRPQLTHTIFNWLSTQVPDHEAYIIIYTHFCDIIGPKL